VSDAIRRDCEETLFGGGPCALCGRDPAAGFAMVGDDWYCHGDCDAEPTCYMRAQRKDTQSWAVVSGFGVLKGVRDASA